MNLLFIPSSAYFYFHRTTGQIEIDVNVNNKKKIIKHTRKL